MPLLDTRDTRTALDYWKRSRHLQALSPADKKSFVDTVVIPDRDQAHDPLRRRLLQRLVDRVEGVEAA